MPSFIETAAISAFAAVVSGLVLAGVNYRLGERSRRMDLYKLLYPEKVKAVQGLMEKATTVFYDFHRYWLKRETELLPSLHRDSKKVFLSAYSLIWLLGPEIEDAAENFERAVSRAIAHPSAEEIPDEEGKQVKATLDALAQVLRAQMHADELDALLPPSGEKRKQIKG